MADDLDPTLKPGTAQSVPAPLRNEIATVARDPWNPASHMAFLLPLDDTLITRGGGKGLKIYDELERDGQVFSCLRKRKMALLAYPWQLDPASDAPADKAARDLVETQLKAMNFDQLCIDLEDAILKGFAVGEVMWSIVDGYIAPHDVKARNQRRFTFDLDSKLRMRDYTDMYKGVELPERKFIVHSVGSKDSSPFGLGLGTILFWYVLFKRQDLTFWVTFLDKFGTPTPVGTYEPGTSPEDQQKLLNSLYSLAQDSGIIIPSSVKLDLLEAQRSGSVDAYEKAARYFDEQITLTILGETLSTSVGGAGSYAASKTHDGVRLELVQADGQLLASTLNLTLITWLTKMNIAGARPPVLKFLVDEGEDLSIRATRDSTIAGMGFKPTLKYIVETYGGEWVEKADEPKPAIPAPGEDGAAFAEPGGTKTARLLTDYSERLAEAADPHISAMVDHVRLMLGSVSSLEEARDRLIKLYPKLDQVAFAEVMMTALTASAGAGAFETSLKVRTPSPR